MADTFQSEEGDAECRTDDTNDENVINVMNRQQNTVMESVEVNEKEDEMIDWENETQHSSEEELEVINKSKRKWSQVLGVCDSSSDDEVRDLTCPIQFCASPPANLRKPERTQSPPAKLFHFSQTLSPRKRHRQNHATTHQPRPCLDFEKMQQLRTRAVSAWRPSRQVSLIC